MTVSVLLSEKQSDFIFSTGSTKRNFRKNILSGIAVPHTAKRSGRIIRNVSRKHKVALRLIRIPNVDHTLNILIRNFTLEARKTSTPASAKHIKAFFHKTGLAAMRNRLFNILLGHSGSEKNIYLFIFPCFKLNVKLQRKTRISAGKR